MKTTATEQQLHDALDYVNKQYADNICFKDIKRVSAERIQFTLTVKNSREPGGRRSRTGRRIAAVCWHVHGHFFEHLFNDDVKLIIAGTKRMESEDDNWQDWNIGSIMEPMYYSNACDC